MSTIDERIAHLEAKLAAYLAAGWHEDLDHVEEQLAAARAEKEHTPTAEQIELARKSFAACPRPKENADTWLVGWLQGMFENIGDPLTAEETIRRTKAMLAIHHEITGR